MKKGFTLVEIMVVVIIVGILTAVATPKLFGLIAKARAAEVPVAAGTYVSLQNAYLGENSGIGSWRNIGYGAPGDGQTEYFEYSGCINGTIPFANMEPDMPGWLASNRSDLNSCRTGNAWAIIIDPAGEREIEYRQIITSADCAALTTSWGSVGETVEGMCETTGELHVAGTEDKTPDKPEETTTTDDDTPTNPEPNPPEQSSEQNTENPEPQQGNCDALAESMTGKGADKGNKYGWVCVSACGVFAPPGKARNAGFDTRTLQKKKDTGGSCEKVKPESNTTDNNPPTEEDPPVTQVDGDNVITDQGQGGGSVSGTLVGSGGVTGFVGLGEYHDFNAETDYCDGEIVDGKCNGTYRPNSECKTWTAQGCKNLGKGQVANKDKCGACQEWKTSN